MRYHLHKFKLDSEAASFHKHRIIGITETTIGFSGFHFHFFYGISSYTNHTHYFSGATGLPIKTENGHVHKMESVLELNSGHEHRFNGYTFEEISYISGRIFREAFI